MNSTIEKTVRREDCKVIEYGFKQKVKTRKRRRKVKPASREEVERTTREYLEKGGKITRLIIVDQPGFKDQ